MAPPIGVRICTVVFFQSGGMVYIWTVDTWRESVLQVTGSLLHVVLACRLAELSDCWSCDCIQVPRFHTDLLLHLGRVVGGICRTVAQDCFVDVMATGNSQPEADRKGIERNRVHMKIPWNALEAFVTLDSAGVFVLDTAYVPDVLGLRTRYHDAAPVKVLKSRVRESVRFLIPDAKGTDRGFHNVMLVDMVDVDSHVVPVVDLCLLRCQWPLAVVSRNRRTLS